MQRLEEQERETREQLEEQKREREEDRKERDAAKNKGKKLEEVRENNCGLHTFLCLCSENKLTVGKARLYPSPKPRWSLPSDSPSTGLDTPFHAHSENANSADYGAKYKRCGFTFLSVTPLDCVDVCAAKGGGRRILVEVRAAARIQGSVVALWPYSLSGEVSHLYGSDERARRFSESWTTEVVSAMQRTRDGVGKCEANALLW